MLEKLAAAGESLGQDVVALQITELAIRTVPPGIDIAPSDEGIVLSGKRLRRRYITDPNLRNFAR